MMREAPYCPRHERYIRNGGCVDCTREVDEAREEGRREGRSELDSDANRYHQTLGAKWMCDAIVIWCRTVLRLNRAELEIAAADNDCTRREHDRALSALRRIADGPDTWAASVAHDILEPRHVWLADVPREPGEEG